MWHAVLIALHATTGVVALIAGGIALTGGRLFAVYLANLLAMEVCLVLAIAAEWTVIGLPEQIMFAALTVLGGVMVWLATAARQRRPAGGSRPSSTYVWQVGFTLVALVDAFVVIAVLNAGAPGWLVAASGVAIAGAGHLVLRALDRRLVGIPDPARAT